MAKLKLPPSPKPSLGEPPTIETEALAEVRQRERTSRRDVIWVAVALGAFLLASLIYEHGHRSDREAAERQAQMRQATAPALPPPGYDATSRYPSAGEVEADAAVREARALVAANAATNAADPMLNPQTPQSAALTPPPPGPPRPFSDPNYGASAYGAQSAAPDQASATPPTPSTTAPQPK